MAVLVSRWLWLNYLQETSLYLASYTTIVYQATGSHACSRLSGQMNFQIYTANQEYRQIGRWSLACQKQVQSV